MQPAKQDRNRPVGDLQGPDSIWPCSCLAGADARTSTKLDDIVVDTIEEPLVFVLVLLGLWWGLQVLVLPDALRDWIANGYYFLVVIAAAWLLTRLFDALLNEYIRPLVEQSDSDLDDQLLPILRRGVKAVIWVLAVIIGLDNAGYDVGALLAGLGIGGLAFAMAAQDTVSNLFGGFTIFTDRPFTINDRIVINGVDGTVKEIGIRSTRLQTLQGRIVTIPNSTFQKSVIENISSEPSRRVLMTLGLTYDTSPEGMERSMELLREIVAEHAEAGSLEESVSVGFTGFGASSMDVMFIYYIRKGADILGTMTSVNLAVQRRFADAGLDFAFPTQTIHHKPV